MSETEEPPTKVQKFELSLEKGKDYEIDEGQEEWLSEELTDDDILQHNQERSDADNTCDDSTLASINDSADLQNNLTDKDTKSNADQQIEQTLDNLENSTMDLPDELGSFLVRKPIPVQKAKTQDNMVKQSEEDDGNDTDDLLRMLGEDDKNKKKQVLKSIKERSKARDEAAVSSDDEIIYQKPKKVIVTKTAGMKQATKALPEDMSTECESSDEEDTMKKMFRSNSRQSLRKQKQKQQNNKGSTNTTKATPKATTNTTKTVAQIRQLNKVGPKTPTPLRQYSRKAPSKPAKEAQSETKAKRDEKKPAEYQAISNEAEFLEDGEIDLNDDFVQHTDEEAKSRSKQRIMKPEGMDEEVPSDDESKSGGESFYDEFPSSASEEDFEDWFHLDIRSESAGDFLPLLGSKAYDLLNEEKNRVAAKIASLKDSFASIVENSKIQSEEVNKATLTLADLDAMLTAS